MRINKRAQAGFTLVEIAIVLIIIGLLVGGVLKGQALIDTARLKRVGTDFSGIATAINSYRDRYMALPGDDSRASRWSAVGKEKKGDNNGEIDDNWKTGAGESQFAWLHMRNAKLINGGESDESRPNNSLAGVMGMETKRFQSGVEICMSNIRDDLAAEFDALFDDGDPTTGDIRANDDATQEAGDVKAYADEDETNICRSLDAF
ncbi:MAG: prepilin-type N-terminal cleavage/methylation domain-containing protein [Magnetococcales bacterium]|nr:prepilin-type N-terminal cleavage/methylation domain-containing protein [Magnetococcales bacterium]